MANYKLRGKGRWGKKISESTGFDWWLLEIWARQEDVHAGVDGTAVRRVGMGCRERGKCRFRTDSNSTAH